MDHIDMEPQQAEATNWPQLVLVLIIIILGFGIAGHSDYLYALEKERDTLRSELESAKAELDYAAARGGIACNGVEAHYAELTAKWVQP